MLGAYPINVLLHYWEVRHSDAVEDALKALFGLLSPRLRLLSDRLDEAY
jgi:hypothetical protein